MSQSESTKTLPALQPLQLSALLFFVPCLSVAVFRQELLVALSLVLVFETSLIVHRPKRSMDADVWDNIDFVCICLWALSLYRVALRYDLLSLRCRCAFAFAVAGLFLNVVRVRAGPYRSFNRRVLHSMMHFCGVAVTLILIA